MKRFAWKKLASKKFLALMLAAVMLCAACPVLAEDAEPPMFATFGEALDAAGENPVFGGTNEYHAVVLEQDGKILRVVTLLDDALRAEMDEASEEEDFETRLARMEAFNSHLREQPVSYVEEITAVPLSQETLDACVGKTFAEMAETDFNLFAASLRDEWLEEEAETEEQAEELLNSRVAVVVADSGLFRYEFTLDVTRGEYWQLESSDNLAGVKVVSVAAAGISAWAADLDYHADGTYSGPMNLTSGFEDVLPPEIAQLMGLLTDAMNGRDPGELDEEALIEALIRMVPDQEDMIREMVPLILPFMQQEAAEGE